MSPCDIPLRVRIFLMLSPSLLLINIIIAYEILHFQTILYYNSSVEEAKQNQKFPFHFLSAPPTPPVEENKKGKENFGVCPRPKGADEARRLVRLLFEKGSSKVYDYSTIHNLVGKFPRALVRGEEEGVGEIRICLASKCEFGGRAGKQEMRRQRILLFS